MYLWALTAPAAASQLPLTAALAKTAVLVPRALAAFGSNFAPLAVNLGMCDLPLRAAAAVERLAMACSLNPLTSNVGTCREFIAFIGSVHWSKSLTCPTQSHFAGTAQLTAISCVLRHSRLGPSQLHS